MGNWRTVNMIGSCETSEIAALRSACLYGDDYENFHALAFDSQGTICGLNDWVDTDINVIGNLAERDYSPEDVAETCKKLVEAAPSLILKIHCGGDYESKKCIATIIVKNKEVSVQDPEIETIMDMSEEHIQGRLSKILKGL
jgi:hypothetical protein